jgi:electron transport complex protein RnfE
VGISFVRELLGSGNLFQHNVLGYSYQPILFFIMPAGGFFVFALFISLGLWLKGRTGAKVKRTKEGCC